MKVTDMSLDDEAKRSFLSEYLHYDIETLIPSLQNSFDRVTLVNKEKTERLTIDTHLTFHNLVTGVDRMMHPLVIVELKRDGLCYSPVLAMLRELRVFPHGFSKYCIGSFKRKIIEINKIGKRLKIDN